MLQREPNTTASQYLGAYLVWYLQVVCHGEPQKYKTLLVEVDRFSIEMNVTKEVGDMPGKVQSYAW